MLLSGKSIKLARGYVSVINPDPSGGRVPKQLFFHCEGKGRNRCKLFSEILKIGALSLAGFLSQD